MILNPSWRGRDENALFVILSMEKGTGNICLLARAARVSVQPLWRTSFFMRAVAVDEGRREEMEGKDLI